jgi:Holliday junction DNA helicase RuvA
MQLTRVLRMSQVSCIFVRKLIWECCVISCIRGVIIAKNVPHLVIEANGLGYEVETSTATFFRLPEVNQQVSLLTHFAVREDAQVLYGFIDEQERSLFRLLIKGEWGGGKISFGNSFAYPTTSLC